MRRILMLVVLAALGWAAPASAQLRFTGPAWYGTDTGIARGMAVGNFNPEVDSDPDVAISHTPGGLSIFTGGPAGSFFQAAPISVGTSPYGIASADFNGDGDLDLAVAEGAALKVLIGGPGTSFAAPVSYAAVPGHGQEVVAADFNADGDPDLAVIAPNHDAVTILLGGAGGSFGTATDVPAGGAPYGLATADLNGDDDPDLVVARPTEEDVAVLLGGSGSAFGAPASVETGGGPLAVAMDDFDGDDDMDMAATPAHDGAVAVVPGTGDGSFGAPSYQAVEEPLPHIAVGDFNGDSDPDLVASAYDDTAVTLLGGTGASFALDAGFTRNYSITPGLATADVNGDGDVDVLQGTHGLEVALNAIHAPAAPTLDPFGPSSPANDNTPTLKGTAPPGTSVRVYGGSTCSGQIRATGSAEQFADGGVTATVADNSTTVFAVRAVAENGVDSECSNARTYVEDSAPPDADAFRFNGTQPSSPANDNHPEIRGESEPGSTVAIYLNDSCSGSAAASGPASQFADPGITVEVPNDSVTLYTAKATDAVGNTTSCLRTQSPGSYTEDSTPPDPPAITATDPGPPADNARPMVRGTVSADSTGVAVFTNATCSGAPAATGGAASFTADGLGVLVPENASTPLSAVADDAAGNVSGCSSVFTYTEDSGPARAALSVSPQPAYVGDSVTFDASGSVQPGGSINRYEWDLDGDGSFETDSGSTPSVTRTYSSVADITPAVRVTSSADRMDTATRPLAVRTPPPGGPVGISINGGDAYTNDRDVALTVVWPPFARDLVLANDGGFAGAGTFALAPSVPWELTTTGAERLPKTVYARFDGGLTTFSDDIVLDESAPRITSARVRTLARRRVEVRVRARDSVSGLAGLQLATRRSRPGKMRRFRSRVVVSRRSSPRYVRVRDRAGNLSRWSRVPAARK